jgi:hypothetical protein
MYYYLQKVYEKEGYFTIMEALRELGTRSAMRRMPTDEYSTPLQLAATASNTGGKRGNERKRERREGRFYFSLLNCTTA